MRRILSILFTLCLSFSCWAITQEGLVRTIARKGKSGQPIEGTIIRLQGSHNKVASRTNGEFSLLLHDLQNGEAYSFASIVKSGYEPAEQELIGKRLPCSDQVPVEILLVSKMQLMQEREAIETKARENVEIYYQAKLDSLEQLLTAKQINETELAKQKQQLESQYENFEPLLQAMSNVLARTDYARMDSLTTLMQQAVENGNPEEAERLLREKGSMDQRESVLREWGKNIQALQKKVDRNQEEFLRQKRELEEDCYRLYSSFLTRFQNDSANYYIQKRALLDTLNVDYQLQAGQFVMKIMADYPLAKVYFERAYRICETQYSEMTGQMATTCNELGLIAKKQGDLDGAMVWYNRSLMIREKIRGKNSPAVAEALNNLGELFRAKKDFKKAMDCHKRALKIREKHFEGNSLEVAESKFGIAGVLYQQGQLDKAAALWEEVSHIYANNPKVPQQRVAAITLNLGGVYFQKGAYEQAEQQFEKAVEIYSKVLGPNHPETKNAIGILRFCKQKAQSPNQ